MKFDLSLDNVIDFFFYCAETDLSKLGEGNSHVCFIYTGLCLKIKIAKSSETCISSVNSFTRKLGRGNGPVHLLPEAQGARRNTNTVIEL